MSGACTRFKQNTWKKELCSNCYRPKEEHLQAEQAPRLPAPCLPLLDPSQGILSNGSNCKKKKKKKKKSVSFTATESEVIGYGGAGGGCDSGSDEDEESAPGSEPGGLEPAGDEREPPGEEEKALERLTKSNTDFNSAIGTNLSLLPLGKQQKQTLQVTIQPFSMDRKSNLSKYLEDIPLITTKTPEPVKEEEKKCVEEVRVVSQPPKEAPAPPMPHMKTIVIENKEKEKEEPRPNPEGRKTHITRRNVITKNSGEQVKSKLYINNTLNGKCELKKSSSLIKQEETKKTDDINKNKIIINTGPTNEKKPTLQTVVASCPEIVESRSNEPRKQQQPSEEKSEVTVKVLKIVGDDGLAESREMAGEPDGKADSDEAETPIAPLPRASFLHRDSHSKEEAPLKEPSLQIGVETRVAAPVSPAPSCSPPPIPSSPPPSCSPPPTPSPPPPLTNPPPLLRSFSTPPSSPPPRPLSTPPASPPARSKRPAPKPPSPSQAPPEAYPRPRRSSLTDSTGLGTEKKKTRVRATLRKLLRFSGNSREETLRSPEEEITTPRPRPEIIHPLDLNKTAVQVLPHSNPEKRNSEIYASTTSIATYSTINTRPSKPPPPPRSESLNLMERLKPAPNSENNVYANLGEGRCGITPVKPQRTGSMRSEKGEQVTPPARLQPSPPQSVTSDNVYECVGNISPPESDVSLPPYYGSETESDIYYPYVSFQNGECVTKMKRKERGIVHSTLEENYGAVVIANHDALLHLFKQIQSKKPEIPQEILNKELTWDNFDVDDGEVVKIGNFSFLNCKFQELLLTLGLGPENLSIPDEMEPLTSIRCPLPCKYFETDSANGKITIMKRKKIERLSVFARKLEKSVESVREGVHVLFQVIKHLLAGREKVNIDNFIVSSSESQPRAAYLPTDGPELTSSEDCLKEMISRLVGPLPLAGALGKCPPSATASLLEVWLWGPASPLALPSLSRWLDLERATFLQGLVLSPTSADFHQLAFLVSATPKSIAHASQILEHHSS